MGNGDNRLTPKMRRKKAQQKLKTRIKRRRQVAAKERSSHKAPAAPTKKSKASTATTPS